MSSGYSQVVGAWETLPWKNGSWNRVRSRTGRETASQRSSPWKVHDEDEVDLSCWEFPIELEGGVLSWDGVNVLPLEIAKQSFLCSETLRGDFSLRRTKYLGKNLPTRKLGDLMYDEHNCTHHGTDSSCGHP